MLKFLIRRRQILLIICVCISIINPGVAEFESLDDHGGGGSSECALLLEGPGRSSAYDYNLNTLRLNPSYGGPHTCITYDAVNNAYVQARKYIRVVDRKERYQNEELATVGELLLEVSRILSRTYGLSVDEIEHGLPLIDTSKTLLREACPAFLSNVHCQPGKYRRYDGLCNNLKHPTWGAVQSTFARLLKPVYSDAISDPRVGAHGSSLPPPRIVSRTIHPDEGYHDHAATILLISWGQFMDHDLTLTATPLDPVTRNEPEECCHRPPEARNPYCIQIDIPHDDPFYGVYGVRCIDFVRGFPGVRAGCRLGSRNQFNILSGIIDGNTVYGVDENFARSLRTGYGGLLRMNPVFAQYGLHDLLPLKLDTPDEGCTRPNKNMFCFDAGEIRVNEQLVLTCMHTLMAREHNRVTAKLGEINPHWDDETLYQEGRRIVIAEIQHITYNEFLPLVLGKEVMAKFGLLLQKEGYWDGYDHNVNPSIIASFAAAAFRFGHSLLPTNVERWSKAHKFIASRRLRDLIRQPYDLYRAGVIDEYFMGMSNQVAQAMDDSVTQEVTNHLFRKPNQPFGVDLAAFNMQRGREFGLPSYMEYRKYCGLPDAHGWDDLFGSMNNITVKRYSQIYVHPGDIDLWSGGVSERPLPGAMVGPTFACIIASQFSNTRRGDRFWYELGGHPHSFSLDQLSEIRKARLARIVCDNTDLIDTIQLYPMVLPDHEINPRVPCRSGVLLHVDLTKWADYGGGAFSHQNPVHADSLSLGAYENDPSVGKYVNQDGLQQLRHYLKVGPYKSFLSGQPKNAFFGYLRQVLTRRPVTLIHSTKGHDASNIANVHYSPTPEHDEIPSPGVDLSPRGFPSGPGKEKGFTGPPKAPAEEGHFVPILPSGGDVLHAPPPHHHHHHDEHPQQFYDFTGTQNQANFISGQSGPSTVVDYEPARPPPPPPPQLSSSPHQQSSYGDRAYPFKGPLQIYYGFKPVATPYGNISVGKEYGSSFRRYDDTHPLPVHANDGDAHYNNLMHVENHYDNHDDDHSSSHHQQQTQHQRLQEHHEYSHLNDISPHSTDNNDLRDILPSSTTDGVSAYGDYPDFNDESNIPISSGYSNDPEVHSYRNAQYKRDVNSVVQSSGTGPVQRNLQVEPDKGSHADDLDMPKYSSTTLTLPRPELLLGTNDHKPITTENTENSVIISRSRRHAANHDTSTKSDLKFEEASSILRSDEAFTSIDTAKTISKTVPTSKIEKREIVSDSPVSSTISIGTFTAPTTLATSLPSTPVPLPHVLDAAMSTAIGFVADFTEMGVSVLSNIVTNVNSFANAINSKLNISSDSSSRSNAYNNTISNIFSAFRPNINNEGGRESHGESEEKVSASSSKAALIYRNESLSLKNGSSDSDIFHKFLQSNQLQFSNDSVKKSSSRWKGKVSKGHETEHDREKVSAEVTGTLTPPPPT